ncbi:MAG: hypothetical protein ACYC4S_00535 [Rhodoferax sp.]
MTESTRKNVTLDDIERRHVSNHHDPYWQWVRLVVSLATGALTVLVTLQGHYVPKAPLMPWMLVFAWGALALSIAAGLLALTWAHRGPLTAASNLRKIRNQHGDAYAVAWVKRGGENAPALHRWSVRAMTTSFLAALCALCWFSAVNLLR